MKLFVIFFSLYFAQLLHAAEANHQLSKAEVEYFSGRYDSAISRAKKSLNSYELSDVEDITRAHKILGAAYCQTEQTQKAKEHFYSVISFSPSETIDAINQNPKCTQMFEAERVRYHDKRENFKISALNVEGKKPKLLYSEQVGVPWYERYAPFGVGHFAQDHRTSGALFLTSETLLTAATVTSFVLFKNLEQPDGTFSDASKAETYRTVFWASLGTAVATALVDVIWANQKLKTYLPSPKKSEPSKKHKQTLKIKPLVTATK